MSPPRQLWLDRVRPWLPWLIFLFAFGFRLLGIGWGLPNSLHNQSYHPDEQIIFGYSQAIEPAHLKFTPGFYDYGTFYLTVLRIASDMVRTYGEGPKPNDLQSLWAFMGTVDLVGRILSALAGAGTALLLYLMLRRFTRTLGALMAGLFVAVAPAFVVHSRFQTVDVAATFLLALSLYYCTLLLPSVGAHPDKDDWVSKSVRFAVLAGLFAGLSAGTKYTGILALLGLWAALRFSRLEAWLRAGLLGTGVALLALIIATPGVVLDSSRFLHDFTYELRHTSEGHGQLFIDVGSGYWYHLRNLFVGVGPMLLVAMGGLIAGLSAKQRWLWVLLLFSIPYYILIGHAGALFLRYTFPLYILLAAAFGWWIGRSHEKQGLHRGIVAVGILGLGWSLAWSAQMTQMMMGSDPRDQIALTLRDLNKGKPNSTVGTASDPWYYTPPLIPDAAINRGGARIERLLLDEMAQSQAPRLVQYVPQNLEDRHDWDLNLITVLKPDYIAISSFEEYDPDRLQTAKNLDPTNKLIVDRFKAFSDLLQKQYEPVLLQNADPPIADTIRTIPDMEYIRPYIWIWKRKASTP